MWLTAIIYMLLGILPWWFKRAGVPLPKGAARNQYALAICGVFTLIMCIVTIVIDMELRFKYILEVSPIIVYALWMLTVIHREMRGHKWQENSQDKNG